MKKLIRVATRGSALALAQTGQLVDLLRERTPHADFELVTLKTTGDRVTDRPLSSFRGTGVFVSELRTALLEQRADLAIHSLKDIPIDQPTELTLAAFPLRADPHDLLLARGNEPFARLPKGATVGTSSPRRMVQLKAARPDLEFADLRGNLDTRIRKLEEGRYDAIVVAAAGMGRLGKEYAQTAVLPMSVCLPAVGQGVLAIECRRGDSEVLTIASAVHHKITALAVTAERAFLAGIGGGCSMPIAAQAVVDADRLHLEGLVGDPQTARIVRDRIESGPDELGEAGRELAERVLEQCSRKGVKVA